MSRRTSTPTSCLIVTANSRFGILNVSGRLRDCHSGLSPQCSRSGYLLESCRGNLTWPGLNPEFRERKEMKPCPLRRPSSTKTGTHRWRYLANDRLAIHTSIKVGHRLRRSASGARTTSHPWVLPKIVGIRIVSTGFCIVRGILVIAVVP